MKTKEHLSAHVETYLKQMEAGNLKNNNVLVLDTIKNGGTASTLRLRNYLGMAHQTLTSRLSHLKDCGLIKKVGKEEFEDRAYSVYKFVSDPEEQKALRDEVRDLKFRKVVKRLFNEFGDLLSDDMTLKQLKLYGKAQD